MSDFQFNPVSFERWLKRNFDANGAPKTPNPDTSLIGRTAEPTTNTEQLECVECGFRVLPKDPKILLMKEWKCRSCRDK